MCIRRNAKGWGRLSGSIQERTARREIHHYTMCLGKLTKSSRIFNYSQNSADGENNLAPVFFLMKKANLNDSVEKLQRKLDILEICQGYVNCFLTSANLIFMVWTLSIKWPQDMENHRSSFGHLASFIFLKEMGIEDY